VKLKYYELDTDARRQVWTNFLRDPKANKEVAVAVTDDEIATISKIALNGREIRNVLQLARSLAKGEKSPLSKQHLDGVTSMYCQFDKEMKEVTDLHQLNQLKRSLELKKSVGLD
jgi:hypothetical protein